MWERILPYMIKKSDKYWWVATMKNEPYKPNSDIIHKHVTLHIWWDDGKNFSATPLRSRIKRVKQKVIKDDKIPEDVKECTLAFKLSRSRQTKHILSDLVASIAKHSMGYSNVPAELKTYLTSLMHNMHYTPPCIATITQQLSAITQKVEATKKGLPDESTTSQTSGETPTAGGDREKGASPIGIRILKLMGRVCHKVKDMSEDIHSLAQDVAGANTKLDSILEIYSNPYFPPVKKVLF